MQYCKQVEQIPWQGHPSGAPGISMRLLRSKEQDNTKATITVVRVSAGAVVPPHVHEYSDDNLYILSGRATMRVADDVFPVGPGDQITVSLNTEHEIYDVTEDLIIYDVFAPPTM